MKNAYSYRRFSSRNQIGNSSIERQLTRAQEACKEHGWTLIDIGSDEAMSAYRQTRDKDGNEGSVNKIKGCLGSFLKKVYNKEIAQGSVLIVDEMSRFSRDKMRLVAEEFLKIINAGIEFYSCYDKQLYTKEKIDENPSLIYVAISNIMMAGEYSKALADKVKRAFDLKYKRADEGKRTRLGGVAPLWCSYKEDENGGKYFLNERAEVVRLIIDRFLDNVPMYKIATELNERNIKTFKSGTHWRLTSVRSILTSRHLIGLLFVNGKEWPNYFPSLTDEETFQKIQSTLDRNVVRQGGVRKGERVVNLWPNKCRCAQCGGTITGGQWYETMGYKKKNKKYVFYCSNRKVGKCSCKDNVWTKDVELDFFLNYLQTSPASMLKKNDKGHATRVGDLTEKIADLDGKIAKVIDAVELCPNVSELMSKLTALQTLRDTYKRNLSELNAEVLCKHNAPQVIDNLRKIVFDFNSAATGSSDEARTNIKYLDAANRLEAQLSDNEVRKKLVPLMGSLVKQMDFDLEKGSYQVTLNSGEVSEPRCIFY